MAQRLSKAYDDVENYENGFYGALPNGFLIK